jgi:hypothetical protein
MSHVIQKFTPSALYAQGSNISSVGIAKTKYTVNNGNMFRSTDLFEALPTDRNLY